MDWFCFLIYWHTNLSELFNAKAILLGGGGIREYIPFTKSISPEVNVKEQLEFKPDYYKVNPAC